MRVIFGRSCDNVVVDLHSLVAEVPMRLALFACAATLTIASGSANAASNVHPMRAAIHPGAAVIQEFALTALHDLKGPAQRPFLNLVKMPPAAQPGVTISTKATRNMSCTGGVCTPTATRANLDVSDLTRMLADGSVTVGTTAQAPDIFVNAAFSWTSTNGLTLQAVGNIVVNRAVSDAGPAPITLTYDASGGGGVLSFGTQGHISFLGTGNPLTINGQGYILASNIQTLAQLIARDPAGSFALSASYNAAQDGWYAHAPIPTPFEGNFEGLGNTISALRLKETDSGSPTGFFGEVDQPAFVGNLVLNNTAFDVTSPHPIVGGVAGTNNGTMFEAVMGKGSVFVSIKGSGSCIAGGLVGENAGTISFSHSYTQVSAHFDTSNSGDTCNVGGLVGQDDHNGNIDHSFAAGPVLVIGFNKGVIREGGLIGEVGEGLLGGATIDSTYATGSVTQTGAPIGSELGGHFGNMDTGATISNATATGAVQDKSGGETFAGGFAGFTASGIKIGVATGSVSAAGTGCFCGGFAGEVDSLLLDAGRIEDSESFGAISATGFVVGGFVGNDLNPQDIFTSGWCTTSSGFTDVHHGAGNVVDDPGITPFTC
jgi:hypothetical protein